MGYKTRARCVSIQFPATPLLFTMNSSGVPSTYPDEESKAARILFAKEELTDTDSEDNERSEAGSIDIEHTDVESESDDDQSDSSDEIIDDSAIDPPASKSKPSFQEIPTVLLDSHSGPIRHERNKSFRSVPYHVPAFSLVIRRTKTELITEMSGHIDDVMKFYKESF